MNKIIPISYENQRIMTTSVIAESYGTTEKIISNNFNRNKDKYQEGKHYFLLQGNELIEFLQSSNLGVQNPSKVRSLYLWTEKGALLHAKSLNTDKAWEVYEMLVENYFRPTEQVKVLSPLEQLNLQSQAILQVNEKVDKLEKSLPLLGVDCDEITKTVKAIGTNALGYKSNAYKDKSLRSKVYSDIYSQLKREFQVNSYKAIKRCELEKALSIVKNYKLPFALENLILEANRGV